MSDEVGSFCSNLKSGDTCRYYDIECLWIGVCVNSSGQGKQYLF